MESFRHTPVLLEECIRILNPRPDGVYVDGTVGGGGHAFAIAQRLTEGGRLIGIDRDADAVSAAGGKLSPFLDRIALFQANYSEMRRILGEEGFSGADGILLDLGVSSYQLDTRERGFSYKTDAPLDMRMDQEEERTARDIVNGFSESELTRILRDYGEERYARAIAGQIVKARQRAPIKTTGELVQIVRSSIPEKAQRTGGHPARRTFQAIRIELNRELTTLEDSLDDLIDCLNPGGRICILTFHSLEDRIVKNAFRTAENPCTCPPDFPVCVCGKKSRGKVLTKKPLVPSDDEKAANSRAKSAKLRAFERNSEGGT